MASWIESTRWKEKYNWKKLKKTKQYHLSIRVKSCKLAAFDIQNSEPWNYVVESIWEVKYFLFTFMTISTLF